VRVSENWARVPEIVRAFLKIVERFIKLCGRY
jgi:hypothetical protein